MHQRLIDWIIVKTEIQPGTIQTYLVSLKKDEVMTKFLLVNGTNEGTHETIRENLHRAPM